MQSSFLENFFVLPIPRITAHVMPVKKARDCAYFILAKD